MGDMTSEPSMEDILSSIKKIIAEDNAKAPSSPRGRGRSPDRAAADLQTSSASDVIDTEDDQESILELTQSAPEDSAAPRPAVSPIVSPDAVAASRQALSNLSRLIVKPDVAGADTLEGLVREMLKPMLKEWLDAHLPAVVEQMVALEVARITGQTPD